MKNYEQIAKSDGYIKNQNIRLRNERVAILLKMSFVAVPLVLCIILFFMFINPGPEKWKHSQVTYADIASEYYFGSYSSFFNTTDDGQFILPPRTNKQELAQQLEPGKKYSIVYSETILSRIIESISYVDVEFVRLDESVDSWKKEARQLSIFTIVIVFLLIVAGVLIYIFGCKQERLQIKKIKSKIDARLDRKKK